jgi:hypothetical protein
MRKAHNIIGEIIIKSCLRKIIFNKIYHKIVLKASQKFLEISAIYIGIWAIVKCNLFAILLFNWVFVEVTFAGKINDKFLFKKLSRIKYRLLIFLN